MTIFSGCIQQQVKQSTTTVTTIIPQTTKPTTIPTTNPSTTIQPQTAKVTIKSYSFNPSTVTINVGTTVNWTNEDSVTHTITSDSGNELNSGQISAGQSYSHTFNQAGTYNYHCSIHYSMSGKVIVE
jgi:plastocyanin